MSRELFNFIWVPGKKGNTIEVGSDVDRVDATLHTPKDAVILYPTLFTPAVYVPGREAPFIELLVACKQELTAADVNVHLKISAGLDPEKSYDPRPLFATLEPASITVEKAVKDGNRILQTHRRFSGILAEQVEDFYKPFPNVFKVSIADSALRRGQPPLVEKLSARATVGTLANAIVGQEPQDVKIASFLENAGSHGGGPGAVPGKRRYGFKIKDGKVDLFEPNPNEPVQSYHPLFVWSAELAMANFGHVSDVHLNARLNILRRSPACVVEDPDHLSPEVGTLLVDTNDSFASVLGKMREDPEVHALAVGGDLIDHIRNAYRHDLFRPAADPGGQQSPTRPTIGDIWGAVDLGDSGLHDRYIAGVDYLIFYSFIVDFCRQSLKPVFGISGNHDAYEEPFGISPRVMFVRGNAGIPADLNLTFYEALLAFGPTWPTIVKSSNFNKDWWVWFYQVFGGFNDFVVRLPDQSVIGLGWGGQEDLLLDEQGNGHLPRSDDAVSDEQIALVKLAVDAKIPMLLFTHFTILSFDDPIPMFTAGKETTATLSEELDHHNMGTFETHRSEMLTLCGNSLLRLCIAGHSHRRGTYEITPSSKPKSFEVKIHDTKAVGTTVASFKPPVIAVSDSSGPMPRLNLRDEFGAWGSDVAGGTLAMFSPDAKVAMIGAVSADRPKPRVAVSLDYLDVVEEQLFTGEMASAFVFTEAETKAINSKPPVQLYNVTLPIAPAFFSRTKSSAVSFTLHGAVQGAAGIEWLTIKLARVDALGLAWAVPAESTKAFRSWAVNAVETFVELVFFSNDAFLAAHYNWDNPWYFEVKPRMDILPLGLSDPKVRYLWSRPSRTAEGSTGTDWKFREIPDFEWRRQNLSSGTVSKYPP